MAEKPIADLSADEKAQLKSLQDRQQAFIDARLAEQMEAVGKITEIAGYAEIVTALTDMKAVPDLSPNIASLVTAGLTGLLGLKTKVDGRKVQPA